MIEIAESPAYDSPRWSSDESDDLETPLQVWRRLYGNPQLTAYRATTLSCASGTTNSSTETATVRRPVEKRRSRRRVNSRVDWILSSSDDDKDIQARPKSRQSKIRDEDDSPVIVDEPSPPRRIRTSFRKKRQTRGSLKGKKRQKKPLEFLTDEEVSANTDCNTTVASEVVSDQDLDDSQKTVLLDTPELIDSFEIADGDATSNEDQTNTSRCGKDSAVSNQIPRGSLVAGDSNDGMLDAGPTSTGNDLTTTDDHLSTEVLKPPSSTHQKSFRAFPASDVEDVDEIFFKPQKKCKKPPPFRSQKKSTGKILLKFYKLFSKDIPLYLKNFVNLRLKKKHPLHGDWRSTTLLQCSHDFKSVIFQQLTCQNITCRTFSQMHL